MKNSLSPVFLHFHEIKLNHSESSEMSKATTKSGKSCFWDAQTGVRMMHMSFDREVESFEIVQLQSENNRSSCQNCSVNRHQVNGNSRLLTPFFFIFVDVTFFLTWTWQCFMPQRLFVTDAIASWAQARDWIETLFSLFSPKKNEFSWTINLEREEVASECRSQLSEITSHINHRGNDGNSSTNWK